VPANPIPDPAATLIFLLFDIALKFETVPEAITTELPVTDTLPVQLAADVPDVAVTEVTPPPVKIALPLPLNTPVKLNVPLEED